jgi:hypothetical protein
MNETLQYLLIGNFIVGLIIAIYYIHWYFKNTQVIKIKNIISELFFSLILIIGGYFVLFVSIIAYISEYIEKFLNLKVYEKK